MSLTVHYSYKCDLCAKVYDDFGHMFPQADKQTLINGKMYTVSLGYSSMDLCQECFGQAESSIFAFIKNRRDTLADKKSP